MERLARRLALLTRGSLRQRITVLYSALFALVLTIVLAIVGDGLNRFGETIATREMQTNARVFREIIELRADQLRSSSNVLARDFGFREAVATGDLPTIRSALNSLKTRSRTGAAFVVTIDGGLIAEEQAGPRSPTAIWYNLDEGRERGIIQIDDQLSLAAASPIEAPQLIGWLVIAQPMDQAEMDSLTELAPAQTDAFVQANATLPAWLRLASIGEIVQRQEDEHYLYHVSYLPAIEDGIEPRLVLRQSLSATLAEYTGLRWLLVVLVLFGIAMVVALSWRVSRTITAPLQELDEATRSIGEGRKVQLAVGSDDEIGRLAESFNRMADAVEERERTIVHLGLHDDLTNLANRRLFAEQLGQALSRREQKGRLMVFCADLDNFKVVNDTLGHPSGDALLCEVARNLSRLMPDVLIARLGGDEFAILIDELDDQASVVSIAEQVRACFSVKVELQGQLVEASASIGIAVAPGDGTTVPGLMKNADLALYEAKGDGKSRYRFFEPSLDEQARNRRQTELDMRTALQEGQFELYYQPLYNIAAMRIIGFEALIRWNHPDKGLVSPIDFIALAEETGLIMPIGEWVLREACRTAATWPDDVSVAVNVSAKQFYFAGLSNVVLQALAESGLSPRRLELEITESIFIANVEETFATLHSLRNLGVRIALDDFGTGYSSLSYLRSFPFDKVKIDRSFVEDLANEQNSHAIVRAITTLADALGMDTLAEGVELSEQFEVLKREGCRNVQGYLVGKPTPASAVDELLGAGRVAQASRVA